MKNNRNLPTSSTASVPGAELGVVELANADSQRQFYAQSRELVSDLFTPHPWFYWIDFSLSLVLAYTVASMFLTMPLASPGAWLAFVVGGVALYRASMFIHEIVHFPKQSMKSFRWVWNIVAGVPMLIPSFTYNSHLQHHSSRHYGTDHDGEYLPLARGSIWGLLAFLAQIVIQPILVFSRFLIGTPISFLHPKLRTWFHTHATSLVINFKYERDLQLMKPTRSDTALELLCCLRAVLMIGLVLYGVTPWVRLPKILLLSMFALTLNHIRTLAAHRYQSHGATISHLEQFQDSTNISGNWLTELLCPLGLRYHGLHHLFPSIPYHNLGRAHRRLMTGLPADSIYHASVYPNTWSVIRELLDQLGKRPKATESHSAAA